MEPVLAHSPGLRHHGTNHIRHSRHTYRSLLDETGSPKGVQQKLMRHANVSITMNVYGNSTQRAKQEAA
jgi:integrase